MDKKSIDIKAFWYSDVLVLPKFVTIVTTTDIEGNVNAAPYSLGTPYDVLNKKPRIMLGIRKATHTFKNIIATKEFVVNIPSWKYLDDVMETARFRDLGENELAKTEFSIVDSKKVSPPSIKECHQHIECVLNDIVEVDASQRFVIGDIIDIVVDEELLGMNRMQRIEYLDLPVYLGDERRRFFHFGRNTQNRMIELKPPEKKTSVTLPKRMYWDDDSWKRLEMVPNYMQESVLEMIEDEALAHGQDSITYEFFLKMEEQYVPKDVQERFD